MPSTSSMITSPATALIVLAHLFSSTVAIATTNMQPFNKLDSRQTTSGCYSMAGGSMNVVETSIYQSSGRCVPECVKLGKAVYALQDDDCLCGDLLPSPNSELPLSDCDTPCPGYDQEFCGGTSAYTVSLTGEGGDDVGTVGSKVNGQDRDGSSTSTSSPSSTYSTKAPASTTHPAHTHHRKPFGRVSHHTSQPTVLTTTKNHRIFKTVSAPSSPSGAQPQPEKSSSSSSTGTTIGIAVGVVAGILAFAGLIAGILFYLRRRRRMKNAENAHRRADSLNAFVASGGYTPSSMTSKFPAVTLNDTRLDPRIMQETRRASVVSYLADNEDYSRRILKVTNPDGT